MNIDIRVANVSVVLTDDEDKPVATYAVDHVAFTGDVNKIVELFLAELRAAR